VQSTFTELRIVEIVETLSPDLIGSDHLDETPVQRYVTVRYTAAARKLNFAPESS